MLRTALVSGPVYITVPIADPAASTVFAHSTFSTVKGSTFGTGIRGTSSRSPSDALAENVPTKELMSLVGASAINAGKFCSEL